MQAKSTYSKDDQRLLVDSLKNNENKVLEMLQERQAQLAVHPSRRKQVSQSGLKILWDLDMGLDERPEETSIDQDVLMEDDDDSATDDDILIHNTLMLIAVRESKPKIVNALLKQASDPNIAGTSGFTPLHEAAREGKFGLVNLLLENGADPHFINEYGDTALHCAAMSGNLAAMEALVRRGASIHSINEDRCTPLFYIKNKESRATIMELWCSLHTYQRPFALAKPRSSVSGTALSSAQSQMGDAYQASVESEKTSAAPMNN